MGFVSPPRSAGPRMQSPEQRGKEGRRGEEERVGEGEGQKKG